MAGRPPETPSHQIAFDTDVLIWYFRGSPRARNTLAKVPHGRRAISSLVLMELLQGCRSAQERSEVKSFISENVPNIDHPDESIARRAIALLEQHASSHGLRVVDALIAATAIENGCAIVTANVKHYRFITGLRIILFKAS